MGKHTGPNVVRILIPASMPRYGVPAVSVEHESLVPRGSTYKSYVMRFTQSTYLIISSMSKCWRYQYDAGAANEMPQPLWAELK